MASDSKREAIHAAAITEFSQRGFTATTMAHLAVAAGMSRPALYQYFRNKGDIFASAFQALVEQHVDLALAELSKDGAVARQVDGFLQRFEGDLWEHMAASPHSEEIINAKNPEVLANVGVAAARLWEGFDSYLAEVAPSAKPQQRSDWLDVVHFSPKGFKADQPSIQTYRRRLNTLARSIASEISAPPPPQS